MSYEKFRNDLVEKLIDLPVDQLSHILSALDIVAANYEFAPKQTDIIVAEECPQIVKIYIASLAVENKSRSTTTDYLRNLRIFFRAVQKPYDAVTTNDIRAFLYSYQQNNGVKNSSLDKFRAIIHGFYAWCVREEYLIRNPAAKIAKIKSGPVDRPRMDAIELETLRSACRTLREKALVDVFYSTGIRVSELIALVKSDIDFDSLTVIVRHGKGDKRRTSYLNAEAVVSLKAYLASRTDDCQHVFVSDRKPAHPLTKDAVEKALHKIAARTSITTNITPHTMRRTTGTLSLRRGMPVEQVQRLLGHANISTTLTCYAQVDDSAVHDAHTKYTS